MKYFFRSVTLRVELIINFHFVDMCTTFIILRWKNIVTVILETGRFDNTDSAVIFSSVSKAVIN